MNKTERIFKIEQMIAARQVVTFKAMLDELEVSRATLYRDLEYLRSRMKTPIDYDRDASGYRFRKGDGKSQRQEFPGLWFNASEAAALLEEMRAHVKRVRESFPPQRAFSFPPFFLAASPQEL